jgi:hypothetical protein
MGKIKVEDILFQEAVYEMADMLMKKGFEPKEAFKVSEDFWKKNKKKLKEVFT